MYTIRQAAELTGFSPDTLRYYEKIGILKSPPRGPGGVRRYSEDNVRLLASLNCLKKTGLSLEEIKEFFQEGQCFANHSSVWEPDEIQTLSSRRKILSGHLDRMEQQRRELDNIIQLTKEKLDYYDKMLNEHVNLEEDKEVQK
ncbi:MerR family transcriptional regulator [Paenibacillus oleatilyticus]|uniref:MerR family transcriptional regulator n=1 Tax=Paenibacillus oleatilyticus TaxID=2594886 RepID=UPI001C1F46DA|nr:MerR family transcriptional regulator [Paenibacillus oleatilyticus]MBU7320756.1 MerR family transcriptional regulator [Paenibacillus oleatilyticus]